MTTKCVTLSVSKALALVGISNCVHLPLIIRMDEKALVLSEKRDCYFTTTANECSCIQFISGVHPYSHQIRAFEHNNSEKVVQEAGVTVKERLEIDQKERLKSEQEGSKEVRWKIELEEHLKEEIAFEQSHIISIIMMIEIYEPYFVAYNFINNNPITNMATTKTSQILS
jgi:hypothetical protein